MACKVDDSWRLDFGVQGECLGIRISSGIAFSVCRFPERLQRRNVGDVYDELE